MTIIINRVEAGDLIFTACYLAGLDCLSYTLNMKFCSISTASSFELNVHTPNRGVT